MHEGCFGSLARIQEALDRGGKFRGIVGTYHQVSKDYLPLYLNEFSFRHDHRHDPDMFGALITTCAQ